MKDPRIAIAALLCAFAASTPAQAHVRYLRDLGDGAESEAAERALVAMGPQATPVLVDFVARWTKQDDDAVAKMRAVARVATLLGRDAAPLAEPLQRTAVALERQNAKELQLELAEVVGSLQPYERFEQWHELFHQLCHTFGGAQRTRFFASMVRLYARNQVRGLGDADAMMDVLAADEFGAREVAAEELGRLGHVAAIDALRDRLVDRDRAAKNSELRHNGFPVELGDRFAWSAGEALIALAPNDPRCAVAYAHRARLHPHRSARLAALMSLASLGPAASDAVPELLELAEGDDERVAAEALKALGMAGPTAATALPRVDALAARTDDEGGRTLRARVAEGLAARLRAMAPDAPATDEATDQAAADALAARVAALDGATAATEVDALAGEPEVWPLLVTRFREEREKAPDAVLELLARLGWERTEDERYTVGLAATLVGGDYWQATMMSTMTGSGGPVELRYCELYGALRVDPAAKVDELVSLTTDENVAIRLAAVRRLAAARDRWAEGSDAFATARDALLAAATGDHPDQSPFDYAGGSKQKRPAPLDDPLHTAAAAALVPVDVPADQHPKLLSAVLAHPDTQLVVAAIERWAGPDSREALEKAAEDDRDAVKAAARKALDR